MGKQKRQRQKPHKENPTGLPSVKDFEENLNVTQVEKEKALQNVYGEVQSCNLEEKLSALLTLESMSCESSLAVQIAKDGIARIVGPLLIDHSISIRATAASTLRQIAENGGEDAYVSLIKDDIMTPLATLLKQHYSEWQPSNFKEEAKQEKETFIQAVTLLWTLCENNENVIKCINEEDLTSILTKFLNITIYGIDLVTVVIQCMVSLSEDNDTAIKQIKQSEEILYSLLTNLTADNDKTISEVLSLKISTIALIINMNSLKDSQLHVPCQISFVNILSEVFNVDHRQVLSSLTSILPHETNAISSSKKKKVQEGRRMLGTQQQALEILANLCFEEEDNAIDSDIDDCERMEIESECMDNTSMNENLKITSTLPVELVEAMNHCNLIDKIWDKTIAVDKDSQDILEQTIEGKAVLKQFHTLRCRAYLCLNNLLSSLEIEVLGGVDNLHRKWLEIGEIVFKDVNPNDIELLEAATAVMRAILQRLAEMRANVFKQLTVSDVQPMLNGERQCSNANIRVNLIRMLGNLILILVNNENLDNHEVIKHVSSFLLAVCVTETQAWIIAECLDAIMDIYAEDVTDRLAADIQLVPKLQSLVSHFKNKVRQQKKHLGDHTSVIMTVNMNLKSFIKYKEKQIRNLK